MMLSDMSDINSNYGEGYNHQMLRSNLSMSLQTIGGADVEQGALSNAIGNQYDMKRRDRRFQTILLSQECETPRSESASQY